MIHLTVNGEEIVCTPEHPFYSPVKGWTAASKLRAGDVLVTVNGEYVILEKIQHELLESPKTTYNFEVAGFHTYYVGNTSLLVHNSCRGEAVKKAWKAEADNVRNGGSGITRTWTASQQNELLSTGKVSGFVGHHIKNVSDHLNLAGDPNNIQFLTRTEHLAAHFGNWRNTTEEFFFCNQF